MAQINLDREISDVACSSAWLRAQLAQIPPDEPIELRINSRGGDVMHGFALGNLLRTHKGPKVAIVDGVCASAATLPALACDAVRMHASGFLMVHNPWAGLVGGAADFERVGEFLRSIEDLVAAIYAKKTGADDATVRGWMNTETWLTPQQAKDLGFVDEILAQPLSTTARAQAGQILAMYAGAPPLPAEALPTPPAPAPRAAAPAPKRSESMDRKPMIESWAAAGALFMSLTQQASESSEADVRDAATKCLAAACMPLCMNEVMTLARAEGMVEEDMAARARSAMSVYAAVERITGVKEGHLGALEALAANAAAKSVPAQASLDALVETELQKGIKALKVLPKAAASWRSAIAKGERTLADLKSWVAVALPAAPQASSDPIVGAPVKDEDGKAVDPVVANILESI